ncbi:hypothetical protein GCM10009122_02380 [Fulvivirga kasyanovii]|uniref:Lipocalin-like domain-containing protein n=1 Tax=Fulvivirga kasyanovii TaxID=396812 RepID=A0ABW9RJZ8_9BACT|nr:hypothetical protein [Fulvivirga kasyanovii]MTI24343.1 hypothetical protein [Fulvivirga kasyanovii]
MKKISFILNVGVLVVIAALSGCKNDDDPGLSAPDQAGINFSGTWEIDGSAQAVLFHTEDRTAGYKDFKLIITHQAGTNGGTYTASNYQVGSSPWKESGSWTFNSATPEANSFAITRNDGVIVQVLINKPNLKLNFSITDPGTQTGRTASVEGAWSFNLTKK